MGCDCAILIQYDNLYAKITDEDSGRKKSLGNVLGETLLTGEAEAFIAKDKVTNGS